MACTRWDGVERVNSLPDFVVGHSEAISQRSSLAATHSWRGLQSYFSKRTDLRVAPGACTVYTDGFGSVAFRFRVDVRAGRGQIILVATLRGLVFRARESLCLHRFRLHRDPDPYPPHCASDSLAA